MQKSVLLWERAASRHIFTKQPATLPCGIAKKHRHIFLWIDDLDFELPDKTLAETKVFRNERDRQLYAALDKLKPEYREAVYLIYLEEMSYRNAAAVMSKSEHQIKNLVYRGKQSLKAILEQEGFEYADE